MENIKLSPRLQAVADLIPPGSRPVDVGTDHGYIPVWLRATERAAFVIASDIRTGPLEAAKASAARCEVNGIDFRLCPGLSGIRADEADTVIIAGMSGETMVTILTESGWDFAEKKLILQPMTKRQEVLIWLYGHGMSVTRETYVQDRNRDYLVLLVQGIPKPLPRPAFLAAGFTETPYALRLKKQLLRALDGLRKADIPDTAEIQKNIALLEDMSNAYGWDSYENA